MPPVTRSQTLLDNQSTDTMRSDIDMDRPQNEPGQSSTTAAQEPQNELGPTQNNEIRPQNELGHKRNIGREDSDRPKSKSKSRNEVQQDDNGLDIGLKEMFKHLQLSIDNRK